MLARTQAGIIVTDVPAKLLFFIIFQIFLTNLTNYTTFFVWEFLTAPKYAFIIASVTKLVCDCGNVDIMQLDFLL